MKTRSILMSVILVPASVLVDQPVPLALEAGEALEGDRVLDRVLEVGETTGSREDPPPPEPAPREQNPMLDRAERVIALLTDPSLPSPDEPDDRPQLPRRTRQAHLSAKLRRDGPAVEPEAPAVVEVDPDAARNRMSALQRGTMRGRAADPERP